MKNLKVRCGDWHRGWGYGGQNNIGKLEALELLDNNKYRMLWKGHKQGRHGQIWARGMKAEFIWDANIQTVTEHIGPDSLPDGRDVIEAATALASYYTNLQNIVKKPK